MVKLQGLGNNSKTVNNIRNLTWGKNDQHIKIYLPCNIEVNLITHLGVIKLTCISYSFLKYKTKSIKILQFDEKRAITPRWVIRFTSILQGR
jgi:hypothetical protein